jgi:uncharacterized protein YxeA
MKALKKILLVLFAIVALVLVIALFIKKEYSVDGTVGFIAAWDSDNKEVGKGEQEIINLVEGDRIDLKLRFKKPFEAEDDAYLITQKISDNETNVIWGFKGKMNYPLNFMLLFMNMEKMLGDDLQTGLVDLKTILEKQ